MDGPRRGTLRPSIDPYSNARPGLPVPMSTAKRLTPSGFRQSLAGPQQPFPLGGPRQSLHPSQSINVPPSASKMGNPAFGRTPMRNSVHKGSQWGAGRQSMVPPTPGPRHALKDPRNIRDKTVQATMRASICSWLQDNNFEGGITSKSLNNCSAKDFRSIFMHLVYTLDDSYVFGDRKFEDEVLLLLKAHAYPFAESVDKKWLTAPSSPFSWPSLLAMLHWMTELCKAKCNYLNSDDPTLQAIEHVPDNFDDPNHHAAIAFQYCSDAYGVFLDGLDDFSTQDQFVEDRYARKNEGVLTELEMMKMELQTISTEYTELTEKPAPIVELEAEFTSRTKDKKKFDDYFLYYENRKRKVIDAIAHEEADITTEISNLQLLKQEQERLAIVVKEQNLSPEEVANMNSEQEFLARTIDELRRKTAELNNHRRSVEIALAKRSENVEHAIDEYTDYLEKLGLLPSVPSPLPSADIRLEPNFASPNPQDLVRYVATGQGADLKNDVKAVVKSIADYKRREHQGLEDLLVNLEQALDEITQEVDKIDEEILDVERRTSRIQEEAESIRLATQEETMVNSGEVMRLEKELAHARNVALANGRGVKSRLQALQIAYQEQIERVDRLKDETVRMVLKSSSDIAAFKEEVSSHLNHLRQFAEEN